jgi:VWFA-related protein
VALAGTVSVGAQEQLPLDRLFTGDVRVDVVEIEVFVTDADGRPVFGLDREAFSLWVDGREMAISNFRSPPAPMIETTDTPSNEEVEIASAPPRHLAVFVDRMHLLPDRRAEILASLQAFLDQRLEADDRVMLAAYDGRIQVLSPFGDDPANLHDAIREVDSTHPSALEARADFLAILRCLEVQCQMPEYLWDSVRIFAREQRHHSRIMLAHLGSFIESLAGLPGRRAVLLVSDGIPVRPGESLFAAYQQRYEWVEHYGPVEYRTEANRLSLSADIEALTDLANERRVTIYSLNGGGVVNNPLATKSASLSGSQIIDIEIDFVRDSNFLGSLDRMAVATGGRTVLKPTDQTMAVVGQDLETAYSLGFNPGHEPDDKTRKIAVRVEGKGLRVRHRPSYRLATDEGRAAELTRLALITSEGANPLQISAEFAPGAQKQRRRYVVEAAVRIPVTPLTLIADAGRLRGELDVTFLLEDEDGNSTPLQNDQLPLDLPGGAASDPSGGHLTYDVGLLVRSGNHRLALTVTDVLGSTSSTLSWDLTVTADGSVSVVAR